MMHKLFARWRRAEDSLVADAVGIILLCGMVYVTLAVPG
jgi:hypothetical protein